MKNNLSKLGIHNVTKEILLGGGNLKKDIKVKINKIVVQYLVKCNRKV